MRILLFMLLALVPALAQDPVPPASQESRQTLHVQPAKERTTAIISTTTVDGIAIVAHAVDPKGIRTIIIRGNGVSFITCKGVAGMAVASCTYLWKLALLRAGVNANSLYINVINNAGESWNLYATNITKP